MEPITQILNQLGNGEAGAAKDLLPLVYEELRKLAASKLGRERPDHTLQATALVHEAWLRIARDAPITLAGNLAATFLARLPKQCVAF